MTGHADYEFDSRRFPIDHGCETLSLYGYKTLNKHPDPLAQTRKLNQTSAFNQWCGFEVVSAEPGKVEIAMPWRPEVGQYAGFLHAGLIGALIDTACGFAAVSIVGRVIASHYSVNCLRPAVGERFIARARVVKPGKSQVFTACELFAESGGAEKLVATGETLLLVQPGDVT
jgi:uncharacterized protein (TIGR00369 family)